MLLIFGLAIIWIVRHFPCLHLHHLAYGAIVPLTLLGTPIPVVDVIKLFLEEIEISPKLRNGKKFVLMSEPTLKCENNTSFKQIYTLKLFIALKWPVLAVLASEKI